MVRAKLFNAIRRSCRRPSKDHRHISDTDLPEDQNELEHSITVSMENGHKRPLLAVSSDTYPGYHSTNYKPPQS